LQTNFTADYPRVFAGTHNIGNMFQRKPPKITCSNSEKWFNIGSTFTEIIAKLKWGTDFWTTRYLTYVIMWVVVSYWLSSNETERNGLRRRKRRIACHRWVCWWAWSPILELQTRQQLSPGQALRLLRGWTPFRTALL